MTAFTDTNVTVTANADGSISVDPLGVQIQAPAVGDMVVINFNPGTDTQITGIAGLPTNVQVVGPNATGSWTASYSATSVQSVWTYFVSALHTTGAKASTRDPEIDNTPPLT